jgi:hypothetical protein
MELAAGMQLMAKTLRLVKSAVLIILTLSWGGDT